MVNCSLYLYEPTNETITIMAPQVFCALREWQSGKHESLNFKECIYKSVYEEFKANLQELMGIANVSRGQLAARRKAIAREGL